MLGAQLLGPARPVQRVAQQDQPGDRLLGGQQAGYATAVGLATDDARAKIVDLLAIGADGILCPAQGQADSGALQATPAQALDVWPHRLGRARGAVSKVDAHCHESSDTQAGTRGPHAGPMEPARIVPLHPAIERAPSITIDGDRLIVERLAVAEPALVRFVGQRPPDERAEVVERALRIGLLALQDANASLDVDLVRREFEGLLQQATSAHERAAKEVDALLRTNFADGDGRLPRTLERFLGDKGQLQRLVAELFDEGRRDSALGRIREMLGRYFDGDASRLAQLLDPTRLGSPLHQFRVEVNDGFTRLNERLTAIEAAASARGAERARSAAKGTDFEDLLERMLADLLRGRDDTLSRTAVETGNVIRSKKGDYVLTVDPLLCRGSDVRVVIEAKDRAISARELREELAQAKRNRGAQVAMVVMTPAHAPAGAAPFDLRHGDVYCVVDPESPDPAVLDAAVRLARLLAIASLREQQAEVDASAVATALGRIRNELDSVRALKVHLTSIGQAAKDVHAGLDRLRDQVLVRVAEAEAELQPGRPA